MATRWPKKGTASKEKFYRGKKGDTAWNNDLLWRMYVRNEAAQLTKPAGEEFTMPDMGVAVSPAASKNPPRMRMGVTGSLIPVVAPPSAEDLAARSAVAAVPRLQLSARSSGAGNRSARSALSSRSSRSALSSRSTLTARSAMSSLRAPSEYSVGSSISSRAMADLRETIKRETQNMQSIARKEIAALREAMEEETRRREQAERKIDKLTALLRDAKE
eukprot:g5039.t1